VDREVFDRVQTKNPSSVFLVWWKIGVGHWRRYVSFTSMKDVAVSLDGPLRCTAIHFKIGPLVNDNHIVTIGSESGIQLELSSLNELVLTPRDR
jgi:hypothetical protein